MEALGKSLVVAAASGSVSAHGPRLQDTYGSNRSRRCGPYVHFVSADAWVRAPAHDVLTVSTDDVTLVARAAHGGDRRAFEQLVLRHEQRVIGYLRRLCKDPDVAADLAQDTFVKAWRRLAGFRGQGAFEGWLLRIAYMEFLQHLRRLRRQPEAPLTEPIAATLASTDARTEDLDTVLALVSTEQRAMLVLVYGFGYTFSETAAVLDLPTGTVKSHVSRAKKAIHAHLADQERQTA